MAALLAATRALRVRSTPSYTQRALSVVRGENVAKVTNVSAPTQKLQGDIIREMQHITPGRSSGRVHMRSSSRRSICRPIHAPAVVSSTPGERGVSRSLKCVLVELSSILTQWGTALGHPIPLGPILL
jgi:hypothetical protein